MKSLSALQKLAGMTIFLVILLAASTGAAQQVTAPLAAPSAAPPQQVAAPAEGQTLHILVGKSVVVNVQSPITRVLSSNPAVIETLATSRTEVVVEGRAAGTSSL